MPDKAVYQSISDVSNSLNIPAHVLRFWETQFDDLKPVKKIGGRRYYRQEDIDLVHQIYDLLYTKGYTIKGAQKYLKALKKEQSKEAEHQAFLDEIASVRDYLKGFLEEDEK